VLIVTHITILSSAPTSAMQSPPPPLLAAPPKSLPNILFVAIQTHKNKMEKKEGKKQI
jgi:hypothetical protein